MLTSTGLHDKAIKKSNHLIRITRVSLTTPFPLRNQLFANFIVRSRYFMIFAKKFIEFERIEVYNLLLALPFQQSKYIQDELKQQIRFSLKSFAVGSSCVILCIAVLRDYLNFCEWNMSVGPRPKLYGQKWFQKWKVFTVYKSHHNRLQKEQSSLEK